MKKVRTGVSDATPAPPKQAEFTVADEAMTACADKTRLALVERHAHRLGMATIPEATVPSITGHRYPTMTFGLYSGGLSLAVKRDALDKLAY